jgi:hypothetical protein
MKTAYLFLVLFFLSTNIVTAQTADSLRRKHIQDSLNDIKAHATEYYTPVPPIVTPGTYYGNPPSDAIILFDGKNLDEWVDERDTTQPAKWIVTDNVITVNKKAGDIQTKKRFTDYQLHVEYRIPSNITGSGQARGNS